MVPELDLAGRVAAFCAQEVGPWWPPERRLVDTGDVEIPCPFADQRCVPPDPVSGRATIAVDRAR